jgi:hypothetical protein
MTEAPPSIRIVKPELPVGAGVLLERMLAKAREARPATASALVDAIDHYETLTLAPPVGRRLVDWLARVWRLLGAWT